MKRVLNRIRKESEKLDLRLIVKKTKVLSIGLNINISINGKTIREVDNYMFLGCLLMKNNSETE